MRQSTAFRSMTPSCALQRPSSTWSGWGAALALKDLPVPLTELLRNAKPRSAFEIPQRSVMGGRQPVHNKPKPGSYFSVTGGQQGLADMARRSALKKTRI